MCGICCVFFYRQSSNDLDSIGNSGFNQEGPLDITQGDKLADSLLQHRGPDATSSSQITLPGNLCASMHGCVLHLRGELTPQPITSSKGNILLWNGEIFGGIEVNERENDTQVLFDALESCVKPDSILQTLQQVHGPWAFIYWQADCQTLWFGRDMFGRRSLLWHLPENCLDEFVLASVALGKKTYKEIPSVGIFSVNFSQLENPTQGDNPASGSLTLPNLVLHPWADCRWPGTRQRVLDTPDEKLMEFLYPKDCAENYAKDISVSVNKAGALNRWIPTMASVVPGSDGGEIGGSESPDLDKKEPTRNKEMSGTSPNLDLYSTLDKILQERPDLHSLIEECTEALQAAVSTRVRSLTEHKMLPKSEPVDVPPSQSPQESTARVAVLFSGGLDSTLVAALADRCVPQGEPIDLLNVAFEQMQPPAQNQNCAKKDRKQFKRDKHARKSGKGANFSAEGDNSSYTSDLANSLTEAGSSLTNTAGDYQTAAPSADPRVSCTTSSNFETSVDTDHAETTPADFSSVKSAGHQTAAPTASCNTRSTFETPVNPDPTISPFDPYNVPDRQTARVALSELNPARPWNFVEINVTQSELQSVRQKHISRLIYPLRTVLDDSIGCAVWFAARGRGQLASDKGEKSCQKQGRQSFVSRAQILLCGMAADELFAGYSRHRVTFSKHGWPGLEGEIEQEIWRISARNLGRDDRIITDHGKEARFPFLDEGFVELVSRIPLQRRVDFSYPRGVGEKLLLRLCAHKLGLARTACQAKRAIQFGSKIAKMDNKKEKGSDVCDRLS